MIKTVKKYLVAHEGNNYKPHLLRERSITVLACIGLVLLCTSLGGSYVLNKTDFGASVLPAVLVDLTNNQRLANGGKALTVNPTLEKAALMKAKDMAENHYFAHTSPTGATPWGWFSKAGYQFSYAGENLAINFTESADVENAWIASPTHYANLISDKFDETGIATYQGTYQGQATTFVVQLFGRQPQARRTVTNPLISTANAEEQVNKATPEKVAVVPEVKGESVKQPAIDPQEPAPVLVVEDKTFAVAKNMIETEPMQNGDSEPSIVPKYSTTAQRLLVNQSHYVQNIYFALIILIYLVLIGMIVTQVKYHHFKNIALAILLLCLLVALAYLNSSFILSFV
jgi:hypothetical protein